MGVFTIILVKGVCLGKTGEEVGDKQGWVLVSLMGVNAGAVLGRLRSPALLTLTSTSYPFTTKACGR